MKDKARYGHLEGPQEVLIVIIVAAVAVVAGGIGIKFLDRLRRRDAETEAGTILERARRDAENLRKETEIESKELLLQHKTESEKELRKIHDDLRERERVLEKRQSTIEQQAEHLRKQERMVESTQIRLTERIEEMNRRNEELTKLLDMHRQKLHELSGLSHDEAVKKLLELLDAELIQETGAVIAKHENVAHVNPTLCSFSHR